MIKKSLLQILCLILCLTVAMFPVHQARAQEIGSLAYYDVPQSEYYDAATGQYKPAYYQWKLFLEYNPQSRAMPALSGSACRLCGERLPDLSDRTTRCQRTADDCTICRNMAHAPALFRCAEKSYEPVTIYFDFDKSNIRHGENEKPI